LVIKDRQYRYCINAAYGTCNWLIPVDALSDTCTACQLNRTIPSLTTEENLLRWKNIERAKHRLVYSLLRLHLPVNPKVGSEGQGIAFNFLADASPQTRVMTGHEDGVITLNIEEADETSRTKHKLDLGEKYRTLLGHFRHEIGHYYWDVLIRDSHFLEKFRELFGDERKDYNQALEEYYAREHDADWSNEFISLYATSHPWEDWAESWSHYMHLMDTLETAYWFGIGVQAQPLLLQAEIRTTVNEDPYTIRDFNIIIKNWLPLIFAINSMNRSMGHADFYPFIISPPVIEKLKFIHEVCRSGK
jgi:hypothetical protein